MNQKIYTREIRVPRRSKPLKAKDVQKYVKADLKPGGELLQVALKGIDGNFFVFEVGIQQRG